MNGSEAPNIAICHALGIRGIARYTHNLANAVSSPENPCSLITSDRFELAEEPRQYRLLPLFRLWEIGSRDNRPSKAWDRLTRPFEKLDHFLRYESSWRRTARWARTNSPAILHVQEILFWWEVRHILRMTGKETRLVVTSHNVEDLGAKADQEGGDGTSMRRAMRKLYDSASAVIVHGLSNRDELAKLYPGVADRVRVIHHGCEPPPENLAGMRAEGRRRLGLDADQVLALSFGEIKPYKGIEDLLEAAPLIEASSSGLKILVAGLPTDPDYARSLTAQRDSLAGRGCRVDLSFQYYPSDEMALLFAAADIVVLPHRRVYQSGVLCQAISSGKALIVTDVGALGETVRNTGCGLVTDARNPGGLAECLSRLADNPGLRSQMGNAGLRAASGELSWESAGKLTTSLYEEVLARDGRGR